MVVFLGPIPLPCTSLAAAQAARAAAAAGGGAAAANTVTPQMFTAAIGDAFGLRWAATQFHQWFFGFPPDTSTVKLHQDVFEKGIKSIVRRLPSPWGIAGGVIAGYGLIRSTENLARRLFPDFFE